MTFSALGEKDFKISRLTLPQLSTSEISWTQQISSNTLSFTCRLWPQICVCHEYVHGALTSNISVTWWLQCSGQDRDRTGQGQDSAGTCSDRFSLDSRSTAVSDCRRWGQNAALLASCGGCSLLKSWELEPHRDLKSTVHIQVYFAVDYLTFDYRHRKS